MSTRQVSQPSLISSFFTRYLYVLQLGNVYIADTDNNRIRMVTVSTGIITTIAGTGGTSYSGDNGPATSASLNSPCGVVVDSTGISLYR
jgi:hypothetical protein